MSALHPSPNNPEKEPIGHPFRTLQELLDYVSGKHLPPIPPEESLLAEKIPFPFLAIVGQREMKLALLLGVINPNVGGILLIGTRGTAKTTAVRSLLDLLPATRRSLCYYGCTEEDVENGGIDAVCPTCAKKYGEGQPLTAEERIKLVELPLNATLPDVIGTLDARDGIHERMRVRRGILAQADRNLLYIDEVNLLDDAIVDAILDAAAQGIFTVRRGALTATYRTRFTLIGSMNPEEGRLRPQILDRFGLRVLVRGLETPTERLEAYRRVRAYLESPQAFVRQYAGVMAAAAEEVQAARDRLPQVTLPDPLAEKAIASIQQMGIDSLRAEITWFEAARAHAAADGRRQVTAHDLRVVAPLALRLRRSAFMTDYFSTQQEEDQALQTLLETLE